MQNKTKWLGIVVLAVLVIGIVTTVIRMRHPVTDKPDEKLMQFIHQEITDHFAQKKEPTDFSTVSTRIMDIRKKGDRTTVYLWLSYEEYFKSADSPVTGISVPAAITMTPDDSRSGWKLVDFQIPRDGAYYADDIRQIFPKDLQADALYHPKYVQEISDQNRDAAVKHYQNRK